MNEKELNILLIKFDQRSRERALVDCFNQQGIRHDTLLVETSNPFLFIKIINREIFVLDATLVVFVGYHRLTALWLMLNRVWRRLPSVIRLGGNPISVPYKRANNTRKYLSPISKSWFSTQMRHLFNTLFIKSVKNVIVVTNYLAQQKVFSAKQVFVLPPAVADRRALSLRHQVQRSDKAELLCVTNLNYFEKYQGVAEIINNLSLISSDKELRLKVVGGGDYLPMLKDFANSSNVDFEVEVCGYQPEISSYYHDADIFIYSSSLDAWPNVLMEAMINGLPIVCNYHPSFCEVFDEGQRSFLYDSANPKSFVTDLQKLLSDNEFLAMRSQQSLDRIDYVSQQNSRSKELISWLKQL